MISRYVLVRVDIDETQGDPSEVINEMDYEMIHPSIMDTEIIEIMEDCK